jgi:hypothetical protein
MIAESGELALVMRRPDRPRPFRRRLNGLEDHEGRGARSGSPPLSGDLAAVPVGAGPRREPQLRPSSPDQAARQPRRCRWVARPPRRMSSSSCCGTRSPSSVAPTHDHAWTGLTERSSPLSSGGCPEYFVAIAWSPRTRSCAGIGASCAGGGPIRSGSDGRRSTMNSSRWWCRWRGEPALGIPVDPGRAAQARSLRRRLDDPSDPSAPPDPTGAGPKYQNQAALRAST